MDLAERDGTHYLVIIYHSRYPEIFQLLDTKNLNHHIKMSVFSRQGIPREVQSDNGTQYSSQAFKDFAAEYQFSHITSSPRYAQSNGQVEAAIKNPSPITDGRSLRDTLPATYQNIQPKIVDKNKFIVIHDEAKSRQKAHFDRRHRTREIFPLQPNQRVWITDLQRFGKVISEEEAPRSFSVSSHGRIIRRNKYHLNPVQGEEEDEQQGSYPLEGEKPTVRTMPRKNMEAALEEEEEEEGEDWVQQRSLSSEMVDRQRREEDEEE
ncbi:hypothetical protein PR048_020559 [Dryococelus australis]|uniref:Integrase catalytic domain-containing protein n=1 Tax=Dryococelus australis TaxID=614101 RepID=A0ABQ9H714_9NEOP|nr:hypothetical protein PR048_020559 [Dryococelus australis]